MTFFEFCVRRPVMVTMRIAAFVLLGAVCFMRIPVDLLPKVSLPTVSVSTSWPNVAPEEMETEITRRVEQAVSSAPNIYAVESSTSQGNSRVSVQFRWGTDIGQAAVDILQLVERAKRSFPNDPTLQNPVVFKFDPSAAPILTYGISGIKDSVKLRALIDNEITPMIESADGVAAATVSGGDERAVIVNVDVAKMRAYGVSLSDVTKRLTQENVSLPAGIAKLGSTEFTIRSVGDLTSPEEASHIPLGTFNGRLVSLGDVAEVKDSHQETRVITRLNGEPAVGISITKQSDANTIQTAEEVKAKIAQAVKMYPELQFKPAYDQSGFIENSIDDLKLSALIGGTLAVLILMFFLRSVRSTLVVALSIPVSIVSTFALIYFCGFSLNTLSLSGLALATGLIVDDAVVVLENIFRHVQRDGKTAWQASISGGQEIASAVVASTLTVAIVFLPLLLVRGQAGQMFTQFALVVIFSISVSLIDATTAVPMLASRLITEREILEEDHPEMRRRKSSLLIKAFDWFGARFAAVDSAYRHGLQWALRRRKTVLVAAFGASALSLLLVWPHNYIGTELMPQTDSGDLNVSVRLPIGTALSVTHEAMLKVEKILLEHPDVQTVFVASGSGAGIRGAGSNAVANRGSAVVKLRENRRNSSQEVVKQLQRKLSTISGIRAQVRPTDLVTQVLTGGNTNMEIDVFGHDLETLTVAAKSVMDHIKDVPGLQNLDVGNQDASPEIQWKTDRRKAATMGVSFTDVASALGAATNGSLAGYYKESGFQYPIYVQVAENERKTLEQLLSLPVTPGVKVNGSDAQVLLRQVATPEFGTGPNQITRLDRQRYIAVTGRAEGRSEGEVQEDVAEAMKSANLPAGTFWDFGLDQKRRGEEFSGMGLAVLLAIGLIYMLLATQFESFVYPLVVLTSVPLCAVGVVLALYLTGRPFGLTAYIGILMLVGIVVKNGILLVDYTNRLRERGLSRTDAILRAGPTRLRPILMTTSAAILGMFPLALSLARGSETQAPLATAVIGGLATSTMLTLFVVPVVYTLFDDLSARMLSRRAPVVEESAPEPDLAEVTKGE